MKVAELFALVAFPLMFLLLFLALEASPNPYLPNTDYWQGDKKEYRKSALRCAKVVGGLLAVAIIGLIISAFGGWEI